ncbi:MAG: glutamate racemase [Anaerotruncus sp.]|nr:glutamate racemase [Anaerotruncus sp.]
MDNRAIGIFDSGLGGLTTVKEMQRLLPQERIIYFGDTGRVPYGSRSRETLRKYAMQDVAFLKQFDCKLIIAACGTISSVFTPEMQQSIGVPFTGVVQPTAQAACAVTNGRIGVIGTSATIHSGAYGRAIRAINPNVRTFGNACPLFVPLVENGFVQPDNEITTRVAEIYLKPIQEAQVDTLILGCTHYPLLTPIIDRLLNSQVTLINAGEQAARWAQNYLMSNDLLGDGDGACEYFISDTPELFAETAGIFLGEPLKDITQISIEELQAAI